MDLLPGTEFRFLSSQNGPMPPPIFAPIPAYPTMHLPPFTHYPSESADSSLRNTPTPSITSNQYPLTTAIENTPVALSLAFAGNAISTRMNEIKATWQVQCPDCQAWIQTGIPSSTTFGDIPGHFQSLSHHRSGKRCQTERLMMVNIGRGDLSSMTAHAPMQPPPRTTSAPPDPLSPVKRSEAAWYSQNAYEFDDAYVR